MVIKNKKGLEVSMGMMITIVIGVITLILALALLRNLFSGATESVDDINEQLKTKIRDILAPDTDAKIFIALGNDKIAKVRADGQIFSFWTGARTIYGTSVDNRSSIQFTLELDPTSNCYKTLKAAQVSKWFVSPQMPSSGKTGYSDIRDIKTTANDIGSARIQLQIPEGTPLCTQDVYITFYDNTQDPARQTIAGSTFTINVLRKSLL